MRYLFVLFMLFPAVALAEKNIKSFKTDIINAVEDENFVDEAFFHNGLTDEDRGDDLGVYFNKKFLENENKQFFKRYTISLCYQIKNVTDYHGEVIIYFYQRTLIRKYNEEGKARCYISEDGDVFTKVYSRFNRYSESGARIAKSMIGTFNFVYNP